ncbi:tellurite resistance TerB family protein [Oceanithermus sp.]
MAGFTDVLGSLLESQLSGKTGDKLKRVLGGSGSGGDLEQMLGRLMGGSQGGSAGGLGGMLGQLIGGGSSSGAGGLGGMLGQLMGGGRSSSSGGFNVGGLEALAGQLLGGGGKASSKDLGGGLMAVLGSLAMGALSGGGQAPQRPPLGLRAPQTPEEEQELESAAQVILVAMINAAKADGRIDPQEAERIVGRLDEMGADQEVRDFVYSEMAGPLDTRAMVEAARGNPELAAQVYAASLLAVEVDTAAENRYLEELQRALGLAPEVADRIERTFRA